MRLLIANEKLAKASEPRVRHFNHPTSRTLALGSLFAFLTARAHVRRVVAVEHVLLGGSADEAGIGAEVLASAWGHGWARGHDGIQSGHQLGDVMVVSCGHDDRQRDAMGVDQQHPLASIFFPGRWGWAPPTPVPVALSVRPRRCSAIARRYPPSRHTRPVPPATVQRKTRPSPIPETACGWRSRCQTAHRGALSIGSRYAIRTRSPRIPRAH